MWKITHKYLQAKEKSTGGEKSSEKKKIKSSSKATTNKQKTSVNTVSMARNYSLHIFGNFAQLIDT